MRPALPVLKAKCVMEKKMKIPHLLLSVLAVAAVLYTVHIATHSGFNFGILLVELITLCLVAWACFFERVNLFLATVPGRVLLAVLAVGAAVCIGVLSFLLYTAHGSPPSGSERVMVVLGCGLRGDKPSLMLRCRLDKAYSYYCEHPDILIVTTGGQGLNELVPEGRAMKQYLVAKGVPEEQIFSEEKSTSTEENFLFSRKLLAQKGVDPDQPVICVTNGYHCYRGREYARMAGFEQVSLLPAATPPTAVLPSYLREVMAAGYYWFFKSSRTGFLHPFVGILSAGKKFFYR